MSNAVSNTGQYSPLHVGQDILEDEGRHEDIYRGEPPDPLPVSPQHQFPQASVISLSSTSSSSSSSSSTSKWSGLGLRRGGIGAVLERAINRWARATSGSSTSSSSSTSTGSVHTRVPRRKRTHRPSVSTSTQNVHSENVIRARLRARVEGRALPREFTLFLPKELAQRRYNAFDVHQQYPVIDEEVEGPSKVDSNKARRLFQSTPLPLTVARLDSAMKRSAKLSRKQERTLAPENRLDNTKLERLEIAMNDKGKGKEVLMIPNDHGTKLNGQDKGRVSKIGLEPKPAWWLDVSSPTWSDMRELGKMLHLHPLTLEDILHQETREKLEVFPRLGYYFIVFRALESDRTRAKATQLSLALSLDKSGKNQVPLSRGSIGATNTYIVVFRDGICTFHFEDIADHTLRVRNRILQLEESVNMTSDWIAHGLLDSIVDQFFPLLNTIEKEVKDLDDLVLSLGDGPNGLLPKFDPELKVVITKANERLENESEKTKNAVNYSSLGHASEKVLLKADSNFGMSGTTRAGCGFRRISYFFSRAGGYLSIPRRVVFRVTLWPSRKKAQQVQVDHTLAIPGEIIPEESPSPLVRMASTRRLVTSLTRLLGTKGEVISRIRKRLVKSVGIGAETTIGHTAAEVGIYLDDIQDHIQTLHQALAHYERILSLSHPTYLSHLRLSLAQTRGGTDKAFLLLTALSVCILSATIITGLFSMNVGKIPRNGTPDNPSGGFTVFGAVIVMVFVVTSLVVSLARWWWIRAGKKFKKRGRGF